MTMESPKYVNLALPNALHALTPTTALHVPPLSDTLHRQPIANVLQVITNLHAYLALISVWSARELLITVSLVMGLLIGILISIMLQIKVSACAIRVIILIM